MPGDLILSSLEIQRFRCFRELRIERLGRVNLIVGKNNVGKSTILEALRLFARPGSFADLLDIFASRNEIADPDFRRSEYDVGDLPYQRLFFGRLATISDSFEIGPVNSPKESLKIYIVFVNEFVDDINKKLIDIHRNEVARLDRTIGLVLDDKVQLLNSGRPILYRIHRSGTTADDRVVTLEPVVGSLRCVPFHAVGSSGLGSHETERVYEKAVWAYNSA